MIAARAVDTRITLAEFPSRLRGMSTEVNATAGGAVAAYRPTVAVHVVWHPACAPAGDYARALFAHLFDDPDDLAAHGLRIPVRLWRSSGDPTPGATLQPPEVPPIEEADRAVVAVLIDDEFLATNGWLQLLDKIAEVARADDVIIPVRLSANLNTSSSPLLKSNIVGLDTVAEELRQTVLLNRVTHALCRQLTGSRNPVTVFLSHAKRDGVEIATSVRAHLQDGSGIRNFFDTQDLLEGSAWADELRGEASRNVLVAIRTDAYATREWCRTEVIEAKLGGSPVIVLDALTTFEPRGFPYLGNAPSVRWHEGSPAALEQLLGVVLRETLRFRHFPARVADLCEAYGLEAHDRVLATPPELLTVMRLRGCATGPPVVYPDPPLGTEERALVSEFAPDLAMVTPTGLIARR